MSSNSTSEEIDTIEYEGLKYIGVNTCLDFLERFYLPVLIIVGSMGNCLSIFVLLSTKMRRNSSSLYLAALALSDTGFLVTNLITWLLHLDIPIADQQGFCQINSYMTYVCSFLSAWFVVSFTSERFVAVCYPLHRQTVCTTRRAKITIGSFSSISLIMYSPWLFGTGPQSFEDTPSEQCSVLDGWEGIMKAMNLLDVVCTFGAPFILIATLNVLICVAIWRTNRIRKSRLQTKQGSSPLHQFNVTKMLLVVSSVFIVLNLPDHIIRCFVSLTSGNEVTEVESLLMRFNNLLLITNFAMNFGLYCLSGQNFRAEVFQLFKPNQNHAGQRRHTEQPNLNRINSPGSTDTKRAILVTSNQTVIVSCKSSILRPKNPLQSSSAIEKM